MSTASAQSISVDSLNSPDNTAAHPEESAGRQAIRAVHRQPEDEAIRRLLNALRIDRAAWARIESTAVVLIDAIRGAERDNGEINALVREYSLSSDEGLALMTLAESLLRIPDNATRDRLIRDKLADADFAQHVRRSAPAFVNFSSRALAFAGWTVRGAEKDANAWRRLAARIGEPVLRQAMLRAMALFGAHFVLGQTIEGALHRARKKERQGFRYSYDMLGEAALTARDAQRYFDAYAAAIRAIGRTHADRDHLTGHIVGPGISIKLSALHPRYELRQRERDVAELYPRVLELAIMAKQVNIGCTIDAEDADRLDLSLDIIGKLIHAPELAGWQGLGLAIQAYSKRTLPLIDWLTSESAAAGRRLMVRLVKGAYWDTEIKRAQEQGLDDYPVFTRKEATDLSYLVCAQRILAAGETLFGQFASHNAATAAAILEFAGDRKDFEFQRLHGMGEALYDHLNVVRPDIACRIYAPVGAHHDLLAYLVRRLLENATSASFVNQIGDPTIPAEVLMRNPVSTLTSPANKKIPLPRDLYRPQRPNSSGVDFGDPDALRALAASLNELSQAQHRAFPIVEGKRRENGALRAVLNPADQRQTVGQVREADASDVAAAVSIARASWLKWEGVAVDERAACLERAADRFEVERNEYIALLVREAGKTLPAAVGEVHEAIDLLRYYAATARTSLAPVAMPGPTGENNQLRFGGRGVFVCIAPWNFPLAIFIGQVAAALVAGNTVIAKPAEQTPLVAAKAVECLLASGVPGGALAFLPGDGATVGAALVTDARIAGVAFTGSTATARAINKSLADRDAPIATLIAETGGINAMIVDSSALLEQAVADIVVSAFDSAGQRCSALRCVYVQEDIADNLTRMLAGAIAELKVGNPAQLATDVGPIIDAEALQTLNDYAAQMGHPLAVAPTQPSEVGHGFFFAPRAVWIDGIETLKRESFGPILHVARYRSEQIERVLDAIADTGYGLTLGVQTRIDAMVDQVRNRSRVGNLYVNRSMIGAVVGTQPFGGEGFSGTGPKAGGPNYVRRFATERTVTINTAASGGNVELLVD